MQRSLLERLVGSRLQWAGHVERMKKGKEEERDNTSKRSALRVPTDLSDCPEGMCGTIDFLVQGTSVSL